VPEDVERNKRQLLESVHGTRVITLTMCEATTQVKEIS
jgi:hypothetical protein